MNVTKLIRIHKSVHLQKAKKGVIISDSFRGFDRKRQMKREAFEKQTPKSKPLKISKRKI